MDLGQKDAIPAITDAIRARLVTQWEAWKNQDTAAGGLPLRYFDLDRLARNPL